MPDPDDVFTNLMNVPISDKLAAVQKFRDFMILNQAPPAGGPSQAELNAFLSGALSHMSVAILELATAIGPLLDGDRKG